MTRWPRSWRFHAVLLSVAGTLGTVGCSQRQAGSEDTPAGSMEGMAMHNQLTSAESAAGWRLLFDGREPSLWRVYRGQSQPGGWFVQDGALKKAQATDDILTRDQFGDFELAFEWMLSTGGNAGVFYRGTEEYDHVYWSAPEYQLLDDAGHADSADRRTSAGAAYALYPAPAGHVKPAGEWNSSRIIARGAHVEHWLNGVKLLEYELWSPDWEAKVKASKFVDWPNFARAKRGYIAIQGDHEGELSLRNIKIRELAQ